MAADPIFYFAVTFWGKEYRQYFAEFCLPSLMAEGNVPALRRRSLARLLIATTLVDWTALQDVAIFRALKDQIEIEFVPFEPTAPRSRHELMLVMSQAHSILAQRMFKDRVCGVFLYPDMIAATGFVRRLEELAIAGIKVALCISVRFANEGILAELREKKLVGQDRPLSIPSKDLVRMTLRHLHSETARCCFEAMYSDFQCASFFWVVRPGEDVLFHSTNWVPAFINYQALDDHDVGTFTGSTLDGDYVARNFAATDVHVIDHSAEAFMISFTSEKSVHFSLRTWWPYCLSFARSGLKVAGAYDFLFKDGSIDPVRRIHFSVPVRLQGGESTEAEWAAAEKKAARIVGMVERGTVSTGWKLIYLASKFLLHACDFATHRLAFLQPR